MYAPRDFNDALKYAQVQDLRPSMDWTGYCQMFVRSCYGIPPLFSSAWTQWNGLDRDDKHAGGSPSDAPLGAALFYKGSGPYGHVMLAARPYKNGTPAAWSNDLVARGKIDKVARTAPTSAWNQKYLGWSDAINDYDLRLKTSAPPKPKQDKPYKGIGRAIGILTDSRAVAKAQKDTADVATFDKEIARLKKMYAEMRRS